MIKVLPSTNPEKEEDLIKYARSLEDLGVEYLHCDVMDGVFVENKCLSVDTIKLIRNNSNILLDVHLMVNNPLAVIDKYLVLKPSIITVHLESVKDATQIHTLSKLIRSKDILFGISIKPATPISQLEQFVDDMDLILIMSVEPGKSGQKFIESSISKIEEAKKLCNDRDIIIEVDGGINKDNAKLIIKAGAKFLVMGSAFYKAKEKSLLLHAIDSHYKA